MSASDRIYSLLPLFEDFLPQSDLSDIYGCLREYQIIENDPKNANPTAIGLVKALQQSKAKKWSLKLVQEIQKSGNKKLATVVGEILTQTNTNLLWLVKNWKDLRLSEHTFEGLEFLVNNPNREKKSEKLLDVAVEFIEAQDSKLVQFLVKHLEINLNKHIPFGVDPGVLTFMEPMMSSEISIPQLLKIGEILNNFKIISKEVVQKVKQLCESTNPNVKTKVVESFIDGIRKAQNPMWRVYFIMAVNESEGNIAVVHFLDACLEHCEAAALQYFAWHWNDLKKNPIVVCKAFLHVFQKNTGDEEGWLLKIARDLYSASPKLLHECVMLMIWMLNDNQNAASGVQSNHQQTSASGYNIRTEHYKPFGQMSSYSQAVKFRMQASQDGKACDATSSKTQADERTLMDCSIGGGNSAEEVLADGQVNMSGATTSTAVQGNKKEKKSTNDHVLTYSHDTRSQKDIKVYDDMTCMEPYTCQKLIAIQKPEPSSKERILEIRVIVEKKEKKETEPLDMFVYVDDLKGQFPMHRDSSRSNCFHTFVCVLKEIPQLTYKYLAKTTTGEELWEALPNPMANRNRKMCYYGQKNYILFDVCTFPQKTMPMNEFESMYTRNLKKHLPLLKQMHLSKNCMSYKLYHDHINQWWSNAACGITFFTNIETNFQPTANSLLREHLKKISQDFTQLSCVAIHLAVCSVMCEFKIAHPFESQDFWKMLSSKLEIDKMDCDEHKLLYKAVEASKNGADLALKGVLFILEKCNSNPNCLLLLPLVYLLMNNGDCTYNQNVWNKMKSKSKFMQLQHSIPNITKSPSNELNQRVKSLAKMFPAFPKLYQELFSLSSMCKLLKDDSDFLDLFDAEVFLSLIVSKHMDEGTSSVLLKNPTATNWVYINLQAKTTDPSFNIKNNSRLEKDVKTLFSCVSHLTNGCKNLPLLLWALSLVFLFPLSKEEMAVIARKIKTNWIDRDQDKGLPSNKIQLLNDLVDLKVADKTSTDEWKMQVQYLLKTFFVEKFRKNENFIHNFGDKSDFDNIANNTVVSSFHEAIRVVIEEQAKKPSFLNFWSAKTNSKLLNILENMFMNQWRKTKGNCVVDKVLQLFRQPVAMCYIKISESIKAVSSQNAIGILKEIMDGCSDLLLMLRSGTITVKNLQAVLENKETFSMVLLQPKKTHGSNVDQQTKFLGELFQARESELESLKTFQKMVHNFVNTCQSTVKGAFQSNWFADDITNFKWCDVIKCFEVDKEELYPSNPCEITLFSLTAAQKHGIHEMFEAKLQENETIFNQWTSFYNEAIQAKELAMEETENMPTQLSIDDVLTNVWAKLVGQFQPLTQKLKQGNILLADVEKLFLATFTKEQVAELFTALCRLPSNDTTAPAIVTDTTAPAIETNEPAQLNIPHQAEGAMTEIDLQNLRVNQICEFHFLKRQQHNISAFIAVKSCLGLCGDFGYLNIMQDKHTFSNKKTLGSITESIIKAGNMFKDVTKEKCDLIENFAKQKELVDWLKNMQDRSEAKVMSDLAMISAGESVDDVDRVSCFLSAVMGFAPFLFDLKEDSGLNDLLGALDKIWKDKEDADQLLTKWEATASKLNWLKGIKDFHGSVEKSSLLKVQNINTNGIYIIGDGGNVPTVETSVKLKWINTTIEKDEKDMTLADLQDLQSRLMLIEDKGFKDVQLFIDTLSLVKNLAQSYVDLKVAGCLLFSDWIVNILCETADDGEHNMMMRIGFDKASTPITCCENVPHEMKQLVHVMQEATNSWKNNLAVKRSDFYHLNHFNIQQITYLCHELACTSENKNLPDQVYTLLSVIKHDITHADVLKSLGTATAIENVDEDDVNEEIKESNDDNVSETEKRRQFVRKLLSDDVALNVAKAGVKHAKELNYDEIFLWCLANEIDDDLIEDLAKQFDSDIGFTDQETSVGVVESVIKDKSNLSIKEVIDKLLNEEAKNHKPSVCVNTICKRYIEENSKTSLADCISLDHLGHFLNNIGTLVDQFALPDRKVPDAFVESVNLVICPELDTFITLISIYMHSMDQPLPTASEVLLCQNETTQNDVDLLLRRAVADQNTNGKRIYCLAHTEKLDFEVANSVQITLNQLKKENRSDFTLVIMCASQQHFIASLFNEHKVEVTRLSPEMVKNYLQEKLTVDNQIVAGVHSSLLVTSHKAGLGKSLYISRLKENLDSECHITTVRFLEKDCKPDMVLQLILESKAVNNDPHFVHLDVTPSVQNGINYFLFNLIILGSFQDSLGFLWRKQNSHIYCIEYTCFEKAEVLDQLLLLLPTVTCLSPQQVLEGRCEETEEAVGMDEQAFSSETFQRPYQYLKRHQKKENLDNFTYIKTIQDPLTGDDQEVVNKPEGSPEELLCTLLHYCSVKDPSWSETRHFASFLSCQLRDCEKSVFCQAGLVGDDSGLTGFKNFVVKFMIRMSQDFATPSLDDANQGRGSGKDVYEQHQLRRSWEQSNHPYLFFNEDRMSMTFLNFKINPDGDLLASRTNQLIEKGIMDRKLVKGLRLQRVNLEQNFDDLPRLKKLETLCQVFGIQGSLKDSDPDPTYKLTTDNVVKMLAIHMRFRCDIPVIIMGETGCGKTRMVEFMSKLKATGVNAADCKAEDMIRNMVIVKVHGGITVEHIQKKVLESSDLAEQNKDKTDTLLFLDEANTTEAIYAIKEFVCDGSVCGKMIKQSGLNIVAACNPYRKHSPEAIKRMENAGLGFKVKTDDTTDKLGEIPMRCLVYRVIALPPSMHPLVWDFGQLKDVAERVYIEQMVGQELIRECLSSDRERDLIVHVLTSSQAYMRKNRQECLFVSLRDVERCLVSFKWFFQNGQWLFTLTNDARKTTTPQPLTLAIQALIQAVGMCYHVTLSERTEYRELLSDCLAGAQIAMTEQAIDQEIVACQSVFLEAITLGRDIASNEALRENVFMIVMCSEMRIPLFLIGKPGSSKSLAKTIVTDAMQGQNSNNEVFQKLKQIHVLSFQCSPVTDAVGIESVFKQCASLQKKQDATKFVAVVVLDEIGLAEDSPKMPLKVLHPLLESGVTNSELTTYDKHQNENEMQKRVGFVGISNWALDPAKMNRGLFVHRGAPTKDDLQLTAMGIFSSHTTEYDEVSEIVDAVTKSYLQIEEKRQRRRHGGKLELCDREFFGLRDYYGLLKMIYAVFCDEMATPQFYDVFNAVQRNFNGAKIDCMPIFVENFKHIWTNEEMPDITLEKMIKDNLRLHDAGDTHFCETRYLLLMTNHLAAVDLLGNITETQKFEVVFGSSFPQDNNYTEKCRNINRIKMCMEAGNTVLLLNLKDLYESLYDALNQHYVTFAGQRYVDLGLGGHRVKCRVHKNFRLIVMEDQNVVYDEFPIPLINRLEKHIFTTKSLLSPNQKTDAKRLEVWLKDFSKVAQPAYKRECEFTNQDSFVGYMEDTAGSAVMTAGKGNKTYETAQTLLLNTATCDSVLRLENSGLKKEAVKWQQKYFADQHHDNLFGLLRSFSECQCKTGVVLIDVTSFSHILSDTDQRILESSLNLQKYAIMLITLQQFKTADEFSDKLRKFISKITSKKPTDDEIQTFILLIQCPQAHTPLNLTACAKYAVTNVLQNQEQELKSHNARLIVAFLFTVERHSTQNTKNQVKSYISAKWINVFVDELRVTTDYLGPLSRIRNMKLGELFASGALTILDRLHANLGQKTFSNFADPDFHIDLHHLLCHSLSLALTKLKPDFPPANISRFKHLLTAFSTDDIFCREFVKLFAHKVVSLARDRDSQLAAVILPNSWIKNLAGSSTSLQEGGSFTKTLWLHLRKLTSTMLAYIVSEIDQDQNLDILWCPQKSNLTCHLKQVWLDLFEEKTVCWLVWDSYDKVQQFGIKGSKNFVCQFPFGRKILRLFQKQWELVKHQQKAPEHFYTKIRGTKLNGMLRTAFETESSQVLTCFVHDLVHLHYRCGSGEPLEYQMIVDVLIIVYGKKQTDYDDDVAECSNVPALLFVLITRFSQQLKQVASILKVFPSILTTENVALWLKKQTSKTTITIQLELFSSALDLIKENSEKLKSVNDYHSWAALIREITPVANAILQYPESETQQKTWKALAFGALFLEQLVPAGLNEEAYRGYIKVLLPWSKRLWKGALKIGLNNEQYLNTLVKNLNGSVNKIRLMCLLDWQEISCKQCKRSTVVDPVILPCKHFMCLNCTKLIAMDRKCPTCRTDLPDEFIFEPAQLTTQQKSDMDVLSGNCTSFFLEYLSSLCFPAPGSMAVQTDAKKLVTNALHNLVIQDKTTREMSPLQSAAFDDTPTVRSFILQLLLRYDRENIQEELESHFTAVGQVLENKQELMAVYIRCIEDSLNQQVTNISMPHLLQEQIFKVQNDDFNSQLQHLDVAANLRYILHRVIEDVHNDLEAPCKNMELLLMIQKFLQIDSEIVKICFTKNFCRRYGIGMFPQLVHHDQFRTLVPQYLSTDPDIPLELSSFLVVAGEKVELTKRTLNKIDFAQDDPELLDIISSVHDQQSAMQVALGTLLWAGTVSETVGYKTKLATARSIFDSLQQNCYISDKANKAATDLVLQIPALFNTNNFLQHVISELFIVAVMTTVSSLNPLVNELYNLVQNHYSIGYRFLPTMPQSCYFDVVSIVKAEKSTYNQKPPKEYFCPNNHLYFVGDCTNVVFTGTLCPDCNAPIGGIKNKEGHLMPGNRAGEMKESSQAGYKLPRPEDRSLQPTPERQCNKLSVCVIRFLLHSNLLINAANSDVQILVGSNSSVEAQNLLLSHLKKDLQQFAYSMGKSEEDAALLLHQIFKRLSEPNMSQVRCDFTSMEQRKQWETNFQQFCLLPVFAKADSMINKARKLVLETKQQSDLERLVFEIPSGETENETVPFPDIVPWDHPSLWNYHVNITIKHLRQKLNGTVTSKEDEGAVLQLILESPDLSILCHLDRIVEIQSALVERYRQKVDAKMVENITAADYLGESDCMVSEDKFHTYIELWNKTKHVLKSGIGSHLPSEYFEQDLTLDSPVSMFLPSKVGRGQCALLFTQYVLQQQNKLLIGCAEMLKPRPSFEEVEISQLASSDIISIKNEQVFLPYILANSQYEATMTPYGSKHKIVYRIPALQKQILQRFILHKKLVDESSVQCIEFLQDICMEKIFLKLEKNVKQEKLSIKLLQKLEVWKKTATKPEICDAVRNLTIVVKHLSVMKSDESTCLHTYITKDLMIPSEEAELIPNSSKLCHTRGLFEWFSWRLSLFNQDPFQNIVKSEDREQIEDLRSTKEFLSQINSEELQVEINSLLITKSGLNPEAGLKDYLEVFAEERKMEHDWIDKMPNEILVKHAVHLFKISVQ